MTKPGLLMVGYFLSGKGGVRSVSEELALRLAKRGYPILTTSDQPNRYLRLPFMLRDVICHRHEYQVATVEVYYGWAFLWAEIVCWSLRLLKKPYVLTLHGGCLLDFARRWPYRVRRLLLSAQAVTTPSTLFQTTFSPWRSDIVYLPNAIEIAHYPFYHRVSPRVNLIWLRAFEKLYNPLLALRAFLLVLDEFPHARLTMIGPDKGDGTRQEVESQSSRLGLDSHIRILGAIPKVDVPYHLAQADIFLNTTRYESFGVAVMEAAALGLCIVSTRVGELPRLWEADAEALLVASDNAVEMAYAIRRILTDKHLSSKLSLNARHKAEQFDWSIILPQWEVILDSL